jgi:5-methylcytosine-specific restriction endonuclease McrA
MCVSCGKAEAIKGDNRLVGGDGHPVLCVDCTLKNIAARNAGGRKNYEALRNKFAAQNSRCAITGMMLHIGINASIDHIIPRSLGGSNDMDNLQFVHISVNLMRKSLPEAEFRAWLSCFARDLRAEVA